MGLSGWNEDNKIKLTIDSTKIDGALSDFPMLITLSSGSGQTGFDATGVFDELTTSGVDSNTVLLLHCNGPNGSTDFLDTSGNGHLVTAIDNAQISTAQYVFDRSSGYFDGSGDYLQLADSNDWDFGTGDFTIDWWMRRAATYGGGKDLFNCNWNTNPNWLVHIASNLLYFYHDGSNIYSVSYTEALNAWEHYAFVRSGDNMYYFVNGSQIGATGTGHAARSINGSNFLKIAGRGGADPNCYVDEVRISKGIARWTSNFVPPAGPYGCSWGNRKKIAVTTTVSGVETELYVEIDCWDDTTASGNKQAWLWTKVPTTASEVDTDLYLYYDSTHTTNSGYVGDTGETPAENVWDSNFNAVFHFSEDSYTGAASEIKNSTISGTDAHAVANAQPYSALIGNGLDIDDADKSALTESNINPGNVYTAESFFFKPWSTASVNALFRSISPNQYFILMDSDNLLAVYDGSWRKSSYNLDNNTSDGWHHLAAVSDDTNTYFYIDGVYVTSVAYHCTGGFDCFGGLVTQSWGDIDEVRVSDVQRSSSWIKATYYTGMDDLITYTSMSDITFAFSNPIPIHLSTVYGTSHTLQLITTVSGDNPSYVYDAVFYDAYDDSQIGSTVSGTNSGQVAYVIMQTPSGIEYNWYLTATSSGQEDTSSTYNFTNRFLCSGTTEVDSVLTADIPVRLYRRSNGVLVGSTTSISGGLFEIESTYNENHYAIALHPTDSGTNALIYDWLTP